MINKKPKKTTGLKKREIDRIIKSFLKEDSLFSGKRDCPIFFQIIKDYPNPDFWRKYSLGFKLNNILWFKTADGKNRLSADYDIFHLDLKPQFGEIKLEDRVIGESLVINRKKKSVADLFKNE